MDLDELNATARALVAPGKGILAADESSGTIKKRFDSIDVRVDRGPTAAPTARCCSRTDGRGRLHQRRDPLRRDDPPDRPPTARPLVKLLEEQGIIPGIKVDTGATPLARRRKARLVTEGLDGLRERLAEYRELGAQVREVARA